MDSDFLYLVEAELANEREENSEPIRTAHEIYGIICARSARLLNEIDAPSIDATSAMLRQLVRIAAMCYRAAEDLHLVGFSPESEWLKSPDDSSKTVIRVGEWQGPFNEPDEEGLKIRELSKVQQPDGTWK